MHGSAENQLARGCNGWRRGYLSGALLDVINFINTGNSVEPLKVDGNMLLSSAQHSLVDFKDARAIHGEARTRGGVRGRSQYPDDPDLQGREKRCWRSAFPLFCPHSRLRKRWRRRRFTA